MLNGKDDERRIKSIEVLDGVSHDEFLHECFSLGTIAEGLAQIHEMIDHCECDGINLTSIKTQFAKDYKKMVGWLKEGKIEEVFNEVKAYIIAYEAAHLTAFNKDYENHKMPSVLEGPLTGITKDDIILN